jgi:glutamine amidotransferase
MKKVVITDYGMGNVDSVARAIENCGGQAIITAEKTDFEIADAIILPGVGSFGLGMQNIRDRYLDKVLQEQVLINKIPFLGICLGMQLLATKGWEGGENEGLGWIEGEVIRLKPDRPDIRIPHIGWNEVNFEQSSPLFVNLPSGKDFYFVHSYHFKCRQEKNIISYTPYCGQFVSAVNKNNIFGVQFHPEKSQRLGFQIIKNFLSF